VTFLGVDAVGRGAARYRPALPVRRVSGWWSTPAGSVVGRGPTEWIRFLETMKQAGAQLLVMDANLEEWNVRGRWRGIRSRWAADS
jgi:hypothetical protein